MTMVKENESLAFTHARLRKIFQINYSLSLAVLPDFISDTVIARQSTPVKMNDIRLSLKKEDSKQVSDFTQIISEKLSQEKEQSIVMEKNEVNEDEIAKGMTLVKPLIVGFLHSLFLKSDKHVAEQFTAYSSQFVEFVKSEINRLERMSDEYKPTRECLEYIFGILVPLLMDYVNKILVDGIDEGRDRKDNEIIQHYVQALCSKYSYLASSCTKSQILNFKDLFSLYFDDNNISNNNIMEKIDESLKATVKTIQFQIMIIGTQTRCY